MEGRVRGLEYVTAMTRVLVIEDDAAIGRLLRHSLTEAGNTVAVATDGTSGLTLAVQEQPDVVLLDLGLPDLDGRQVLRMLRAVSRVPVIVVTAQDDDRTVVEALDAGADDYLVKPFNHYELLARCRALLRRAPAHMADLIELGHIRFDPASSALSCAGETIAMSPRERSVMAVLLRNAGSVVPKERIEAKLSEFGDELSANAIELAVSRLRKRLEGVASGVAIETVRGAGYLLRDLKNG